MKAISIDELMHVSDEQYNKLTAINNVTAVKLGLFEKEECVYTNAGGIGVVVHLNAENSCDTNIIVDKVITIIGNEVPFGISFKKK